jgi:hypothetical protein
MLRRRRQRQAALNSLDRVLCMLPLAPLTPLVFPPKTGLRYIASSLAPKLSLTFVPLPPLSTIP